MELRQQHRVSNLNLLNRYLISIAYNQKLAALIIFAATTLTLGTAGRDLAFVREDVMMINLFKTYPVNFAKIFTDGWIGLYGNDFPWIDWAYRPLEMVLDWVLVNLFGESEALQFFFKSSIIGLCAALVYLLAMELTRKPFVAFASAIFSGFSVPMIVESWWYHHIVAYVEVLILLGFLSYLRYTRLNRLRWLVTFWVCALVAPLLGEYGVSLASIALLSSMIDLITKRKLDWKFLAPLPLLVFLGFYPNFLPNLIVGKKIILSSIFDRFVIGLASEQGLPTIVQSALPYLLIIGALPPTLTLMAFISLLAHFIYNREEYTNFEIMEVVLLCILLIIFVRNYPPPVNPWGDMASPPFDFHLFLPTLLPVVFAFLSWQINKFLVLWFVASYVPFIRLHHLAVNLIPALIPWTILLLIWIDRLVNEVNLKNIKNILKRSRLRTGSFVAFFVIIILAIGVAAQVSNIAIVKETWGKTANNTREMGKYVGENLPQGSIVLGEQASLFEAYDMSYYSGRRIAGNFAVYTYLWWPTKQIKAEELPSFLENDTTYPEKYFLIQKNIPQVLYRYWLVNPEQFQFVARFDIKSRIILLDPLYLILPRDVPYHLGFNIVKIYPSGGGPFYTEFTGWYALYKYVGDQTSRTAQGLES